MRVLYFTRDYTTHDRRFLSEMAKWGHELWFLRLEDDGLRYEDRPLPDGVQVAEWGRSFSSSEPWLDRLVALDAILRRIRPDLVHAGPIQTCTFLSAALGARPLLAMSWGSDVLVDADVDDRSRWLTRYALGRSTHLLCDCDAVEQKARAFGGPPPEHVVKFPWGTDLDAFAPGPSPIRPTERPGWAGACVVLSTRSWHPHYGIDTLLDAFAVAVARVPRLRLVLVGDGSRRRAVEEQIARLGLGDAVWLPGMVPHTELPDFFRAADVYLSCTPSDGSSVSLLEALATGLPVIAADAPGNREWIAGPSVGWLAPAGDAEAFARCLERAAVLDEDSRRALRAGNRALAERRADWRANIGLLRQTYERIENELRRQP